MCYYLSINYSSKRSLGFSVQKISQFNFQFPCSLLLIASILSKLQRRSWPFLLQQHGPLARYVKFRVAHAPGMMGTFSPPLRVSDADMHHDTCVTHVPWCMPGLLTIGFLWSRWWGKLSRQSQHMRNPQFYISGKRPMAVEGTNVCLHYLE